MESRAKMLMERRALESPRIYIRCTSLENWSVLKYATLNPEKVNA